VRQLQDLGFGEGISRRAAAATAGGGADAAVEWILMQQELGVDTTHVPPPPSSSSLLSAAAPAAVPSSSSSAAAAAVAAASGGAGASAPSLAAALEALMRGMPSFKMVLVVRGDLDMGKGKVASQCCHGTCVACATALSCTRSVRFCEFPPATDQSTHKATARPLFVFSTFPAVGITAVATTRCNDLLAVLQLC
jgi:hypothetical protein